jgi:outer membrane protein OmpA-like peptidoglycan-associated protein
MRVPPGAAIMILAALLPACAGLGGARPSGATRPTPGAGLPREQTMKVTMVPTIREIIALSSVSHGAPGEVVLRKDEAYALQVKAIGTAGLQGLAWVETADGERLAEAPLRFDPAAGAYAAELTVRPGAAGSYDVRAVLRRQGEDVTDTVTALEPLRFAIRGLPGDVVAAVDAFRVHFDTDVYHLGEAEIEAIGEIAARLAPLAADLQSIRVEGHCDARGSEIHNLELGRLRAAGVARLLAERLGQIPIGIHSLGSEDPDPPGATPEEWALNRWARIVVEAR